MSDDEIFMPIEPIELDLENNSKSQLEVVAARAHALNVIGRFISEHAESAVEYNNQGAALQSDEAIVKIGKDLGGLGKAALIVSSARHRLTESQADTVLDSDGIINRSICALKTISTTQGRSDEEVQIEISAKQHLDTLTYIQTELLTAEQDILARDEELTDNLSKYKTNQGKRNFQSIQYNKTKQLREDSREHAVDNIPGFEEREEKRNRERRANKKIEL